MLPKTKHFLSLPMHGLQNILLGIVDLLEKKENGQERNVFSNDRRITKKLILCQQTKKSPHGAKTKRQLRNTSFLMVEYLIHLIYFQIGHAHSRRVRMLSCRSSGMFSL